MVIKVGIVVTLARWVLTGRKHKGSIQRLRAWDKALELDSSEARLEGGWLEGAGQGSVGGGARAWSTDSQAAPGSRALLLVLLGFPKPYFLQRHRGFAAWKASLVSLALGWTSLFSFTGMKRPCCSSLKVPSCLISAHPLHPPHCSLPVPTKCMQSQEGTS